MSRVRPHIPLAVRVQVIIRQLTDAGKYALRSEAGSASWVLKSNLRLMFGENVKLHLDHNPPLRVRPYNPRINDIAARYTPNANDPEYLLYRTDADHRIKTNQRGDGAQYPDRVLIKRERRRERGPKVKKKIPQRRKYAWPSRPFSRSKSKWQSRKLESRPIRHSRPPQ